MNKVLISLVSISLLSGCSPTPMDKAKQDFVCKDRGGVYEYVILNTARCRDVRGIVTGKQIGRAHV